MELLNNSTEERSLDEFVVERIRKIMEDQGVTRYRLCKLTGITQASLSVILSGKCSPSLISIERLCNGLGISVSDFFKTGSEDEYIVTKKDRETLELWNGLDARQQGLAKAFIQGLVMQEK